MGVDVCLLPKYGKYFHTNGKYFPFVQMLYGNIGERDQAHALKRQRRYHAARRPRGGPRTVLHTHSGFRLHFTKGPGRR